MERQVCIFHRFIIGFLLSVVFLPGGSLHAENWPSKNLELGWNYSMLKQDSFQKLKSSVGFKINATRTYYLTKSSANVRLGLDVIWMSMALSKYEVEFKQEPQVWNDNLLGFNLGPQLGLSLAIRPADKLYVIPYFRYTPTYLFYHSENQNRQAFSFTGISGGVKIVYRFIGCGFDFQLNNFDMKPLYSDYISTADDGKLKTKDVGLRTYILINF